jgi:hypothetical protein
MLAWVLVKLSFYYKSLTQCVKAKTSEKHTEVLVILWLFLSSFDRIVSDLFTIFLNMITGDYDVMGGAKKSV